MDYTKFYEIDDFKKMFYRDNNFDFQPYPTWTKTTYSIDDIVKYEDLYYKSLVDDNIAIPTDTEAWEEYIPEEEEDMSSILDWVAPIAYMKGDRVIYTVNFKYKVFKSLEDDNYTEPVSGDWTEDDETTIDDFLLDADIEKAMREASNRFNPSLFAEIEDRKLAFSYLTAFFLVYDLQMAKEGTSSSWSNPVTKREVGKMAVWYQIPDEMKNYPSYTFLSRNKYGLKYFELVRAKLTGNIRTFIGNATNV
jgi:hypothetical protein